jgi:hypothetical protein
VGTTKFEHYFPNCRPGCVVDSTRRCISYRLTTALQPRRLMIAPVAVGLQVLVSRRAYFTLGFVAFTPSFAAASAIDMN